MSPPSEAARARLIRANRVVTRGAFLLLVAFALLGVATLPLGYGLIAVVRAGGSEDEDLEALLSPRVSWGLATILVLVAVLFTTGPLPERTAYEREPSKRVRRLIAEAARRYETHEPDFVEIVEDRSNLPPVVLADHTQWLFGAVERSLQISLELTGKLAHDELEALLDRAFAGAAGTGRLAAEIRGRASCLRFVNGRMHPLPDEPSAWWGAVAMVRAMAFVLARPATAVMAGFERKAAARVAAAHQGWRAGGVAGRS